jgi:hypothetical protein
MDVSPVVVQLVKLPVSKLPFKTTPDALVELANRLIAVAKVRVDSFNMKNSHQLIFG